MKTNMSASISRSPYREPTSDERLIADVIGILAMLTFCGIVLACCMASK